MVKEFVLEFDEGAALLWFMSDRGAETLTVIEPSIWGLLSGLSSALRYEVEADRTARSLRKSLEKSVEGLDA